MGRPKKNSPSSVPAQASTKKIPSLSGVFDVNTATDFFWDAGLRRFSKVARVYGFSRVEMPLVEDIRLYRAFYGNDNPGLQRLVGLNWDGSEVALRPSQLPGLLRNFFQQKL